jgi:hypothetical protein
MPTSAPSTASALPSCECAGTGGLAASIQYHVAIIVVGCVQDSFSLAVPELMRTYLTGKFSAPTHGVVFVNRPCVVVV